jgi:hypothetical protein
LKKRITAAVLAAVCSISLLAPASASFVEVYGQTKMNLWDLYLTENNAARPDAISTATVDAVSQATYNPYDNPPVSFEAGMDMNLLADSVILKQYGVENASVERILDTWSSGYKTRILGSTASDIIYPIEKSVVKYTSNSGRSYYFEYSAVQSAMAENPDFSWEAFAARAEQDGAALAPYKVKYLLQRGEFGRRVLVDASAVKTPPTLTLDETFGSSAENAGKFIKLNFGENRDWADKVYAVKVNQSGLIAGDLTIKGSYSDHNGDTNFVSGQSARPAGRTELFIRINQKFHLGNNKITFMAYGYQDAEFELTLDQDRSYYPWLVDIQAVSKTLESDAGGDALTPYDPESGALPEGNLVSRGNVITVQATGSVFSGKYDGILIDGKALPEEDSRGGAHLAYYSYGGTNGSVLHVYTNSLTPGLHELSLKKQGYNDANFFFTVTGGELATPPAFTVEGEQITVDGETYSGDVRTGVELGLKADGDITAWYGAVLKVLYTNLDTGVTNDMTDSLRLDADAARISLNASSMQYWNAAGNFRLTIQARGYGDLVIPLKKVSSTLPIITVSYDATDGSVRLETSDSSYFVADKIQKIKINGEEYAPALFEMGGSYSSGYFLIIPSEYFSANETAQITVVSQKYSEYRKKIDIPAGHTQRQEAPAAVLATGRPVPGGAWAISFPENESWRQSVSASLKNSSGTVNNHFTITDRDQAGGISGTVYTYAATGSYTLILAAPGYRPVYLPVELVKAVPGEVAAEYQNDGSVAVSINGSYISSYISVLSVLVDGVAADSAKVTKSGNGLVIAASCFPAPRRYQVTLRAAGYADAELTVDTSASVAPTLVLSGQVQEKTAFFVSYGDNEAWAGKITGARVLGSSGAKVAEFTKEGLTADGGTLSIPSSPAVTAGSGEYTLKISAEGYRDAAVSFRALKAAPTGMTASLWVVNGEPAVRITGLDYSYQNALSAVALGGETVTKGSGLAVSGGSEYAATITRGTLPSEDVTAVLSASGYMDSMVTVPAATKAVPAITLPEEILVKGALALTSGDGDWAGAVTKIELTKNYTGMGAVTAFSLDGGNVTVSADIMAAQSISAGTDKTIRVYADGYPSVEWNGLTFYEKPASAFDRTTNWTSDGDLTISLKENGTASSYYSANGAYVNDTKLSYSQYNFSYGPDYLLTIKKAAFAGHGGQEVTVRITTSYNYPALTFTLTVPE